MALHTLSVCTGLGGIERGLELAAPGAFKPVLYCEREISSAAIIAAEIERGNLPAAPIWSDIKTITRGSAARFLDQVGVECITGGYPCQPFSTAGKRRGKDDPRHLWPWIAEAIERYAPSVLFFENVGGHLVLGFEQVGDDLDRLGYRVAAGLFTAAEVGATHRRERLFIVGLADCGSERPQGCSASGATAGATRRSGGTVVELAEGQRQRPRRAEHAQRLDGAVAFPSYPPAPASSDWRDIIERFPELAPAVANSSSERRQQDAGSTFGHEVEDARRGTKDNHKLAGADKAVGISQRGQRIEYARQDRNQDTGRKTQRRRDTVRPSVSEATQPAFRGVADGLSRADQLRAYGNAVVPECAAVAFVSLWSALMENA